MASRILLLPALLLLLLLPAPSRANVVDRTVAIVNEDSITLSEVNELGKSFFQKISEETPAGQLNEALQQARMTVIDKLIDKKLLMQEAKKYNLRVSEEEIEGALQRVITNNKSTMEQFRKEISSMGMSEKQYRENLREQILNSKLINFEVRSKVVIAEDQIIDYYNRHFTHQASDGGYYILQIGFVWNAPDRDGTTPTQAEARAKAEKIRDLARKGKDFKELAKQYSDLPSAAEGGDLGSFQESEMAPSMHAAMANLKPGDVSPIIEVDQGFQFFKIQSSQPGTIVTKAAYEAVKEEIREKLSQQAMEQRFKDWLAEIRAKAYIKIL